MDLQQFPSISYEHQPNFKKLIGAVTEEQRTGAPITLICGAGVSLDAGLPGWEKLVLRMCQSLSERLDENEIARLLETDPSADRMRKIDLLLRLHTSRSLAELVRDGLYPEGRPVLPGSLAGAIARFVAFGQGRVRLLTTNFDDQLEAALMRYYPETSIHSYGLNNIEEWYSQRNSQDAASVLHVHGMVALDKTIEPIILGESSFLKHSEEVKSLLIGELENSCAVFVGVSMTDPNLIRPLSQITSSGKFFIVSIPETADPALSNLGDDPSQTWHKYRRVRDKYLDDQFGLHPIRLKAPSQVQQLLVELTLAARDEASYNSNDGATSIRYGHRLQRALRYSYQALGLGPDSLPGPDYGGRDISNRLYETLWKAESGPGTLLKSWLDDLPEEWLAQIGVTRGHLEQEGLALFLWLRACRKEGARESTVPYSMRLIGTSAYTHRESWSSNLMIPVEKGVFVAAEAVFLGRVERQNFRENYDDRKFRIWESAVAVPLVWQNRDNLYDLMTLGAITLNSNRRIIGLPDLQKSASSKTDIERVHRPSVMSFLDAKQTTLLEESLRDAGLSLVSRADGQST